MCVCTVVNRDPSHKNCTFTLLDLIPLPTETCNLNDNGLCGMISTSCYNSHRTHVTLSLQPVVADEEVKLLHFIQEQARRDAEISLARRKCIELEETITDYHERCDLILIS